MCRYGTVYCQCHCLMSSRRKSKKRQTAAMFFVTSLSFKASSSEALHSWRRFRRMTGKDWAGLSVTMKSRRFSSLVVILLGKSPTLGKTKVCMSVGVRDWGASRHTSMQSLLWHWTTVSAMYCIRGDSSGPAAMTNITKGADSASCSSPVKLSRPGVTFSSLTDTLQKYMHWQGCKQTDLSKPDVFFLLNWKQANASQSL